MANTEMSTGAPVSRLEKAPKTEEELIGLVDDVWGFLKHSRLGLEQRIKEARHFLSGEQWIQYAPHRHRFGPHTLDPWVPTPVTNFLAKHYDRILDIFTSGDLKTIVEPVTQDQADVEAARAAQRILLSEFHRLNTETNLILAGAGWLVLTGNCVLHAGWNGKGGKATARAVMDLIEKPVHDETAGCPACGFQDQVGAFDVGTPCPDCAQARLAPVEIPRLDANGIPVVEVSREVKRNEQGHPIMRRIRRGEIEEKALNLLNWYPQPVADFSQCRYDMEIDPWPIDEIKDVFGSKAAEVVSESMEIEEHGNISAPGTHQYRQLHKGEHREHAFLKIFRHVADDRLWKDGTLLIVANGHVLHEGKLDSIDGRLPRTLIKYRDVPGAFWGASVFTDLLPGQKRVNSIDSQIVLNRKQMVNNQWLVPDGSGVKETDGRSGLVIRWSPMRSGGFKPERLPGVPLPAQVMQERESVIQNMEEISGAREVLSGDIPPGPETGAAIEALQEQAFRRFGPAVKRWRAGLADHERRKLLLIRKHWHRKRLVRVLGDNKETQSFFYEGADLAGAEDMLVRVGIGLDFSESAKRQKILRAAEMGLMGDIRDPAVAGRILEKLNIEGFESDYVKDAKKAQRVLVALRNPGQEVPPFLPQIDNHAIQYSILREFVLTSDFEKLPQQQQQAIMQRAEQHQQIMQQQQQQALQQAQAVKGTGQEVSQAVQQTGALGGAPQLQQRG